VWVQHDWKGQAILGRVLHGGPGRDLGIRVNAEEADAARAECLSQARHLGGIAIRHGAFRPDEKEHDCMMLCPFSVCVQHAVGIPQGEILDRSCAWFDNSLERRLDSWRLIEPTRGGDRQSEQGGACQTHAHAQPPQRHPPPVPAGAMSLRSGARGVRNGRGVCCRSFHRP
jgi:hypothetical protein